MLRFYTAPPLVQISWCSTQIGTINFGNPPDWELHWFDTRQADFRRLKYPSKRAVYNAVLERVEREIDVILAGIEARSKAFKAGEWW